MIRHAIAKGCRNFIIGLGGSSTNDGGVGMLSALGWGFCDGSNQPIPLGARGLKDLYSIDCKNVIEELSQCCFRVACDVTNPLLGEKGCSAVFAPQKGASPDMIRNMEQWLSHFSRLTKEHYPTADSNAKGVGAAGGLGFAFANYLNGVLEPGAQIITDVCNMEQQIQNCDIIITGEGRLDGQSSMGKAPIHIGRLGKKFGKPVIALVGSIGHGAEACIAEGISSFFSILPCPMSVREAMLPQNAYRNLSQTAYQVFSLLSHN